MNATSQLDKKGQTLSEWPNQAEILIKEIKPDGHLNFKLIRQFLGDYIAWDSKKANSYQDEKLNQVERLEENGSSNLVDPSTENDAAIFASPASTEPTPVSFFALFRFATRSELILDFIGFIAAAVAGAALPLMSLLFGNIVNVFVGFGTALSEGNNDFSNPTVIAAGKSFKHHAAKDATGLAYIGLGTCIMTYVYMLIWTHNGEILAKRIRENYLKAVLRQDITFFDKVGAGEIATRIHTDTHLIQDGTSEKVAIIVSAVSALVTGLVLAYIRSWRLALAITSILPCIMIAGGIMNKFVSKYLQLSRNSIADGGTLAEEVISTIRTAHAFGTQSVLSDLYDTYSGQAFRFEYRNTIVTGVTVALFTFIVWSTYSLAFAFGGTLILHHEANTGIIINVALAIIIGSFVFVTAAPQMQAVAQAQGAAAKIWETIDRIPDIDSASPDGLKPETVTGHIEMESVVFQYPSRPNIPVLKGISLTFEAGKAIALVGASGSGKSTVVSLIERFYDPISGTVKLDGQDLKNINVKWLRSQIGLVSQEPTLFATTIRENVAQGLIGTQWENAPEDQKFSLVKGACLKANADGFISKLPNGYATVVGERGYLLSGGQKQRIAIARAIVSDPRILLLDEATSALDTQSEGVVQNALDKAAAGRTTIAIAHRLSTIKDADKIYVMGEGMVLESGTHSELLSREGPYAHLIQAQKLQVKGAQNDSEISHTNPTPSIDHMGERAVQQDINDGITLGRHEADIRSFASELSEKRDDEKRDEMTYELSLPALFVRIAKLNRNTWRTYAIGSIFAICNGLASPVSGIIYGKAITSFQSTDRHVIRFESDRNALWFFILAIATYVCYGAQTYLFGSAAARVAYKLRSLAFKSILRQDIRFFDNRKNSAGAMTANLSDNIQKINGISGGTLGVILQNISCLVGGSIIGLIYSWRVALVGIACIPLVIFSGYIRLEAVILKDKKNKTAHEDSAQLACEAVAAICTVASLTREEQCVTLYSESLEQPLRRSNQSAIYSALLFAISQAMTFFVIGLVCWYGSTLIAVGKVDTRHFFVCLMSVVFAAIQAGDMFQYVPDISSAHSAANSLLHLYDSVPEIDAESNKGEKPRGVKGHIRFQNVHFCYPTRPDVRVLRDFNIEVKPGTFVALVGASGCGKSTVTQLIERFHDPLAGSVYFDHQAINELNVQQYRRHLALVSQEPTLYSGTIRFNILLGAIKPAEEITEEEIENACRNANILDFIKSLPNGFETEVGGKGSQLSGGQKQRIAIARALIRNPKVLLLDEATSALDSNSERVVQDALDQAAKGRTTIAIAHRLSTIQKADRIYFIEEGRVTEAGTHEELISLQKGYYQYVQLQAAGGFTLLNSSPNSS